MKVHNLLPIFLECMTRWREVPSPKNFARSYFDPLSKWIGVVFDHDSDSFHSVLKDLNWPTYRAEVLKMDFQKEENRLRVQMERIENLFGIPLQGDAILFGAFSCMDGYARFDKGAHNVYLGVDENHGQGKYIDILIAHELTHVVRESRRSVWESFGLDPEMTHDEFTENLPVIEHLLGEGLSCVVSEILHPQENPWDYVYQTQTSLEKILANVSVVGAEIQKELKKADGDYGHLYNIRRYGKGMPPYSHYVWAWQWVKQLLKEEFRSDLSSLVGKSSRDLLNHALGFKFEKLVV